MFLPVFFAKAVFLTFYGAERPTSAGAAMFIATLVMGFSALLRRISNTPMVVARRGPGIVAAAPMVATHTMDRPTGAEDRL